MIFLGHSKQVNQQSSSSTNWTARYDRAQKLQQEQQQFREAFSATILDELVKAVAVEEVLNTADELIIIKEVLLNFVDEAVSEVVDEDVHQIVRDEMEVGIRRRCSEGSCKCQSEIAVLREE